MAAIEAAQMTYDLVVVGGGLIGAAIAWGASRAGASVALLDRATSRTGPRAAVPA